MVTSISELIDKLNLEVWGQEGEFFYRGVTPFEGINFSQNILVPKLYREQLSEKKLVEIAMNRFPQDFVNCRTNIEVLLKLQHYEIPTRLIDITSNPLIGAYFAIPANKGNKNSRILVFRPIIYHYIGEWDGRKEYSREEFFVKKTIYSHSVEIIASLSRLSSSSQYNINNYLFCYLICFYYFYFEFHEVKSEKIKKIEGIVNYFREDLSNIISRKKNPDRESMLYFNDDVSSISEFFSLFCFNFKKTAISDISTEYSVQEIVDDLLNFYKQRTINTGDFNSIFSVLRDYILNTREFIELYGEIRRGYPNFTSDIHLKTFFNDYIVTNVNSNDRIKNQKGAFILMSPLRKQLFSDKVFKVLELDYNTVDKIEKDLKNLGITKDFVYPELQKFNYKDYELDFFEDTL